MPMKTDELYHPQFFTATIIKWKYLGFGEKVGKRFKSGELGFGLH